MTHLLRKYNVSPSKLTPTRLSPLPFQTLLFSSSANVPVPTAEFLTTQHHISPETALKVSSTISHIKNPHKTSKILSCLRQTGFSLTQIEWMINKFPPILNVNTGIVQEKLNIFQDKGFSTPDTIAIISKFPSVLCITSEYRIGQSITELESAMGSTDAVYKVLKRYPWFLKRDIGKTMIPNIEFLKKRSELSSFQVAEYVMRSPRLFSLQPKIIEDRARRLDEMGLKWSSKMYFHALKVVCSISEESLKLKMKLFQGLGISDHDVLQIFQACPHVFGYSGNKIIKTMEVLLGSGRADSSLPYKLVGLLSHSLEKRIKPRLEVVKTLEDRGLLSKKLSLSTIMLMSDKTFSERFVLSNLNALGDDFVIGITKKFTL